MKHLLGLLALLSASAAQAQFPPLPTTGTPTGSVCATSTGKMLVTPSNNCFQAGTPTTPPTPIVPVTPTAALSPPWVAQGAQTCNETWPSATLDPAMWSTFPGGTAAPYLNGTQQFETPDAYKMEQPGVSLITTKQPYKVTTDHNAAYTSAYLIGLGGPVGCGYQKYGWFQTVMSSAPQTNGALGQWSAFWLLPVSNSMKWEIDVFERFSGTYGPASGPTQIAATLHYGSYSASAVLCQTSNLDMWATPHTFAVDWQPASMTIYIDGKVCPGQDNPSGVYTGPGIPNDEPGYPLWDNYVAPASSLSAAAIAADDALLAPPGSKTTIASYSVWQKTSVPQTVLALHGGNLTTDKSTYKAGDTATFSVKATAGAATLSGVSVSGYVFDACGDNNSGFSPCKSAPLNNNFGNQFYSPTITLAANASASLKATWVVPANIPPGLYTVEYTVTDAAGHSDSNNVRLVVN